VSLGVVDFLATVRHGHILAIGSHVNRATLRIQKLCWMVRDGFTASHVGTITKEYFLAKLPLVSTGLAGGVGGLQ
jgi:hypothetical protein